MVAVRNLLSTLNSLAPGLLASSWLGNAAHDNAPAAGGAGIEDGAPEPYEDPYMQGGIEPPLDELLHDPVVRLMMRADRLQPDEVRRLLVSKRRQAAS